MLKELSFEEIQTYFNELDSQINNKIIKAQLYNMARAEADRLEKQNKIEDTYGKDARRNVTDIIIVDDNLSIIKAREQWGNEKKIMFYPVVNMKKLDYAFESLDAAIIYGIAYKNKCDDYANAAIKLIVKK